MTATNYVVFTLDGELWVPRLYVPFQGDVVATVVGEQEPEPCELTQAALRVLAGTDALERDV